MRQGTKHYGRTLALVKVNGNDACAYLVGNRVHCRPAACANRGWATAVPFSFGQVSAQFRSRASCWMNGQPWRPSEQSRTAAMSAGADLSRS